MCPSGAHRRRQLGCLQESGSPLSPDAPSWRLSCEPEAAFGEGPEGRKPTTASGEGSVGGGGSPP
eukprot:12411975-Alexandrium_andersonii.AAC.1